MNVNIAKRVQDNDQKKLNKHHNDQSILMFAPD